jgi:TPR repeat protein
LDADDYMRQGLDAAAIGVLQTHADLGDMRALNVLARIRLQRRQYDQALALYERAAKTGHADSQAVLAPENKAVPPRLMPMKCGIGCARQRQAAILVPG